MDTMRTTGMGWIAGFAVMFVACRAADNTNVRMDVPPVAAVSERNAVDPATQPQRSVPTLLRTMERPGGPAVDVWSVPDGREWRVVATFVPLEPDGTERVHELGRQRPGLDMLPGTHVMDIQLSAGLSLIRTSVALSSDDEERERWFVFDSAGELLSKAARPLGPGEGGLADAKRIQVDVLDVAPLLFVAWVGRTSDGELALWAELRDGLGWSSAPLEVFRRPFTDPRARVAEEPIVRCLKFAKVASDEWSASHCLSELEWTIRVTNSTGGNDPTHFALECTSARKR